MQTFNSTKQNIYYKAAKEGYSPKGFLPRKLLMELVLRVITQDVHVDIFR